MRAIQIRVKANVAWKAFFDHSSRNWVAECSGLKITASGKTWGELCSIIDESLNLLFCSLLKSGELDRFLKEKGWKLSDKITKDRPVHFDIPSVVKPISHNDQTAFAA